MVSSSSSITPGTLPVTTHHLSQLSSFFCLCRRKCFFPQRVPLFWAFAGHGRLHGIPVRCVEAPPSLTAAGEPSSSSKRRSLFQKNSSPGLGWSQRLNLNQSSNPRTVTWWGAEQPLAVSKSINISILALPSETWHRKNSNTRILGLLKVSRKDPSTTFLGDFILLDNVWSVFFTFTFLNAENLWVIGNMIKLKSTYNWLQVIRCNLCNNRL